MICRDDNDGGGGGGGTGVEKKQTAKKADWMTLTIA